MSRSDWTRRHVSGIVLNGGASTRLGRDKATLRVGDRTMLELVVDRLAPLFDEILVVGRPQACPPHPAVTKAIPDAIRGAGPLGGIYTGLMTMSHPFGFCVACDMPCLDPRVIRRQLDLARVRRADAIVPAWDGYWEPLHAAYSQDCLPAARRQLESGDFRIRSFFDAVEVIFWDIRAEGIATRSFTNVNTRGDLAALLGDEA